MNDKIFIEKLVLSGRHGVSDEESAKPQEFYVDISAEVEVKAAAKSDDISDTANYSDFAKAAREVIEGPSCRLIETLARRIAEKVIRDNKVKSVSVTIRKPRAIPRAVAGVTVTRSN